MTLNEASVDFALAVYDVVSYAREHYPNTEAARSAARALRGTDIDLPLLRQVCGQVRSLLLFQSEIARQPLTDTEAGILAKTTELLNMFQAVKETVWTR
jgi:hypothetical protein